MIKYSKDWDSQMQNYASYLRFERNLAPNTIESYMRDVGQLREFISAQQDILPSEVQPSDIEQFMSSIYDRRMEASSQSRILSGVKSFFDFMQFTDIIETDPTEFVDTPKIERKLPDVLSIEEIDTIVGSIDLSAAQGHRNKAIVEILYSCGLRVSELISLTLGDLFFDDGFIRVTGKGNKQRLVPLNNTAQHNIELYLEQRRTMTPDSKSVEIVFLNRRGRKLSRVMIYTIIQNAAEAAGISKKISPHTFRHSFATHLLEGGASIRQVQDMLGHESILTTEIYTHLNRKHLRKSIEKNHPLGCLPDDKSKE